MRCSNDVDNELQFHALPTKNDDYDDDVDDNDKRQRAQLAPLEKDTPAEVHGERCRVDVEKGNGMAVKKKEE